MWNIYKIGNTRKSTPEYNQEGYVRLFDYTKRTIEKLSRAHNRGLIQLHSDKKKLSDVQKKQSQEGFSAST